MGFIKKKNDKSSVEETLRNAEKFVRAQIAKKPKYGSNYASLAEIYSEAGKNIDEAINLGKKAVELAPDFYNYYALGFSYLRKKELSKAIEKMEQSRILNPANPWNLWRLGQAYKESGNKEKAIQVWNEALKFNSNNRFASSELEKIKQ